MVEGDLREAWRRVEGTWGRLRWARMHWQWKRGIVGASAKDAAEALGIEPGTYRAYEREPGGSKHIPLDHQIAIRAGRKFKVDWQWLLLGEGTPFDNQLTEDQETVLRLMSKASESQQKSIVALLETFVGGKTGTDG